MQYLLGNFHKMISDKHQWKWWQCTTRLADRVTKQLVDIIFTSVFHLALSPQEHCLTVHALLFYRWLSLPSVNTVSAPGLWEFIREHLNHTAKLYQRDRQRGTNQFGGMQVQVELSACVWTEGYLAISTFCHGLNKAVGGDWAFWGPADWKASRQCLLWRWGTTAHQHGVMQSPISALQ